VAATINATLKSATANSFVTLAEADAYFETVPSSTQWDNKSNDAKNRALISATRWIDTLNFYGDRCDQDQALSWPRNNYHVDRVELVCSAIPNDIKYATYELANALANDTDSINVFDVYPWLQSYLGAYCLGGSGSYSLRVVRG
jgi:hypothetical protein